MGVMYVLDEPSFGLHQRDNEKLLATLHHLRDLGNTVVVVEHDEATIEAADYLVDIGPGAGTQGGRVVAAGTLTDVVGCPESLTGQYLSGKRWIEARKEPRQGSGKALVLKGCRKNNLQNLTARFPLGQMTCVTGVSGSGKSTLVMETLYPAIARALEGSGSSGEGYTALEGVEEIDKVIEIDQSPIGRTPRSNAATYTGVFTLIRDLFASLPESKARGYSEGRFSFNVKGGRCEACEGDGVLRIEMHFLPDVYVPCDACKGSATTARTLDGRYKDKTIADVLDMSVEEAQTLLRGAPSDPPGDGDLAGRGLGISSWGRAPRPLSGGSPRHQAYPPSWRCAPTGRTFYILDEPTPGCISPTSPISSGPRPPG
jgi:excinuclease ABC subunit A